MHILLVLAEGDSHGYRIMQTADASTGGGVRLRPGVLYAALGRLADDGLIVETEDRPAAELDDQRRRYYQITGAGRVALGAEIQTMSRLVERAVFGRSDVGAEAEVGNHRLRGVGLFDLDERIERRDGHGAIDRAVVVEDFPVVDTRARRHPDEVVVFGSGDGSGHRPVAEHVLVFLIILLVFALVLFEEVDLFDEIHIPVADAAVTAASFDGYTGEAMAIGERTPLALLDAGAAARMAVGEAVTNLASAAVVASANVVISVRGTMISETVISAASDVLPMIARGVLVSSPSSRTWRARRSTSSGESDSSPATVPVMRRTSGSMPRSNSQCTGRSIW